MNILAVGAHPDDLEFQCGGTLAKYAAQEHKVIMCHACNGNKGHFRIPPGKLGRIRREEAKNAAKIIGAESLTLNIDDLDVFPDREATLKFVDLIRQTKPDVIITHSPDDYMSDHTVTSRLVFDASFAATVPYSKTKHKYFEKVVPIYYMDTLNGVGFSPTEYVDITETIQIKKKMFSQHQSQFKWLKERDNVDIIDSLDIVAKFRGLQSGVEYAEGFRRLIAGLRNTTERLLP